MQTAALSKQLTNNISGNGVYERVKARVIAHEFPAGKRILVEPLADQFFVSATPVREALIRLAAERMINDVPKAGFFIKEVSETEIEGLFALQQLLLDWTLSVVANEGRGNDGQEHDGRAPGILKPPNLLGEIDQAKEISPPAAARITEELFVHISRQSGNADVIHMVGNINDRTHYVRKKYFEVFEDARLGLIQLCQAYRQKEFDTLREDLRTHFHDKMERLPDLLRILRGSFLRTSA